jgi:general L-amino acid transport system substrate-binding protein
MRSRQFSLKTSFLALTALVLAIPAAAGATTLGSVRERGELICGVSPGIPGFSIADDKGKWSGFDVDFCRAVAAAVLTDPAKVRFVPLNAEERFDALKAKKIDLLARNSTWTMWPSSASTTMTARDFWRPKRATSPPRWSLAAARSA